MEKWILFYKWFQVVLPMTGRSLRVPPHLTKSVSPVLHICPSNLPSRQPKLLMNLLHLPHNYQNKCTTEKNDSFFSWSQLHLAFLMITYSIYRKIIFSLVFPKFDFGVNIIPTYRWKVFPKFVLLVTSLQLTLFFLKKLVLKVLAFHPDQKKHI
jgi:hypothetical protein